MSDDNPPDRPAAGRPPAGTGSASGETRQQRLAEALRANLGRRKAQKRARGAAAPSPNAKDEQNDACD